MVNVVSEESDIKPDVGCHEDGADKESHHRKKMLELHLLAVSAKEMETGFCSFCKNRIYEYGNRLYLRNCYHRHLRLEAEERNNRLSSSEKLLKFWKVVGGRGKRHLTLYHLSTCNSNINMMEMKKEKVKKKKEEEVDEVDEDENEDDDEEEEEEEEEEEGGGEDEEKEDLRLKMAKSPVYTSPLRDPLPVQFQMEWIHRLESSGKYVTAYNINGSKRASLVDEDDHRD